MGGISQGKHRELTNLEQKQLLEDVNQLSDYIDSLKHPSGFDQYNSNHRLFFRAFDGTSNDRENLVADERPTNTAILEKLFDNPNNGTIDSDYIPGVGTDGGLDKVNYVTGGGSFERAEEAYLEFRKQVQAWHEKNPDAEIYISMAGFSRGTGSARHFANLVYERGVPAPDANVSKKLAGYDGHGDNAEPVYEFTYDKHIIAPGEAKLDTMLIYDSVTTGQASHLKLDIPPTPGLKVLHLTALDEQRDQFNLRSVVNQNKPVDPRINEFRLPGVHSDLGGGYANNALSSLYLMLGYQFLSSTGTPMKQFTEQYQAKADMPMIIHDSDQPHFTTFGERQEYSADNVEISDGEGLLSDDLIQHNLVSKLNYLDGSFSRREKMLLWAKANEQTEQGRLILMRRPQIEKDMSAIQASKSQIIESSSFSPESLRMYNEATALNHQAQDRLFKTKLYGENQHEDDLNTGYQDRDSRKFSDQHSTEREENNGINSLIQNSGVDGTSNSDASLKAELQFKQDLYQKRDELMDAMDSNRSPAEIRQKYSKLLLGIAQLKNDPNLKNAFRAEEIKSLNEAKDEAKEHFRNEETLEFER